MTACVMCCFARLWILGVYVGPDVEQGVLKTTGHDNRRLLES
jgi:hypothetical protein